MAEAEIKIYISSLSGNKEVKKRQQRIMMILESKQIPYVLIDITEPQNEKEKDFMQANATAKGETVSDVNPPHPLAPQIFNGQTYCGDYNGFELANECDTLEAFLHLPDPEATNGNGIIGNGKTSVVESVDQTSVEETVAPQNDEPAAPQESVEQPSNGATDDAAVESSTSAPATDDLPAGGEPADSPADGGAAE